MKKTLKTVLFLFCAPIFGVSSLQVGLHGNIAPDMNNLSRTPYVDSGDTTGNSVNRTSLSRRDSIEFYDNLIAEAIEGRSATGGTVGYPVAFGMGIDLRYNWNHLFLRTSFDYNQLILGRAGSLKTSSYNDEIEYKSTMFMWPISFGFRQALHQFFQFHFGFGPYYSYASLEVTHTDPKAFSQSALTRDATQSATASNFTPYKSTRMQGDILGFHIILGVQVPVIEKKLYVSVEWIHYEGRSLPLRVDGEDSNGTPINDTVGDTIFQDGEIFSTGVQYLIPL